MRLVKYVISVSKRHENNHVGVKNGSFMINYYDEDWKLQTQRINPLLIWYYKLRKRRRVKGVCSECSREIHFLTCWYDKKMECPFCLDEFDEYDDQNLEFGVKIMYDRIRVNNDNLFFDVFMSLD